MLHTNSFTWPGGKLIEIFNVFLPPSQPEGYISNIIKTTVLLSFSSFSLNTYKIVDIKIKITHCGPKPFIANGPEG